MRDHVRSSPETRTLAGVRNHVWSSPETQTPTDVSDPARSHWELEHLRTMKVGQSSVDADNKRVEDDDVEDEAMKTMMLRKRL